MSGPSRKHELAVGILLLVALAILAYLAVQVGAFRMQAGTYRVRAVFEHAGGVVEGAVVSVAGVDVGSVDRIWVQENQAWMELVVSDELELPRDSRAAIRARSVLGEKYVQLLPGVAQGTRLAEGDRIVATEGQVEIDEMVNSMGPLVDAVDPELMAALMTTLSDALAEDPERVERLLTDAEALIHNLRVASEEAPALVSEGRAAVAELRGVAQRVPPMLERGDALLSDLERASGPLADAAEKAPALADEVSLTVDEARALLATLEGSTDELETILGNLEEIDLLALRRLVREDGVLVRLKPAKIEEE
jgi:phospholipid/cholesterol/gamma-HCH transport system substrate-binding protein